MQLPKIHIHGIAVTTSNAQAVEDLGWLWQRFYNETIAAKVPYRINDDIYVVYTDYESNYLGVYTCIIGFRVPEDAPAAKGMTIRSFEPGKYKPFIAKGEMPFSIREAWKNIWFEEEKLNRAYTADFEVYGSKAYDGDNAEITILIAV